MIRDPIPKAKLSRNLVDLQVIPKSHKVLHVIPLVEAEWNIISFHEFLKTLDPQIFQSCFYRGRTGNYRAFGDCVFCNVPLYRISISTEKKKIKFILCDTCKHLQLLTTIYQNKQITFIKEFKHADIYQFYNSPANLFIEFCLTLENLPKTETLYVNSHYIHNPYKKSINENRDIFSFIQNIPGNWYIYLNSNQGFISHNKKYVDSLVYIAPWANTILNSFQYLQLDASFKFTKPACYSLPLMVKYNRSLPIGFSIGLTENFYLYERFFEHLNLPNELCVLCDLGNALKKFCLEHNLKRFICHRHLIERFNSKSLTGYLITKICSIKSEEAYQNFLNYWLPILSSLISNNKPPINIEKFMKYLGLEYDEEKKILFEANPEAKDKWAIWRRGCINTCSNAIESRHGHLNSKITPGNTGFYKKIFHLIEYLNNSFTNFDIRKNSSLQQHRYYLEKKANNLIENSNQPKEKFQLEDCNCCSKKIYEARFNTKNADCIHTCLNSKRKREVENIQIEHVSFETNSVTFIDSNVTWDINRNNRKKQKFNYKIDLDLNDENPFISSFVYMIETIKEISPNIDLEFLQIQMMEIYHVLRNEPGYSNLNENSDKIIQEWRNRVFLLLMSYVLFLGGAKSPELYSRMVSTLFAI